MSQYTILIADDEPDILSVMAKRIRAEGYEVFTAADGLEALEMIVSKDPDVILLDLNMPQKTGFEVLKELRENTGSKKWQPVIIVSARRELEDIQKGFSMEADHYISKPCDIDEILKAIKLMVGLIPQRKTGAGE